MAIYPWCRACDIKWERCSNPGVHADRRAHKADFYLGPDRVRKLFDKRDEALDYERTIITRFRDGELHPNKKDETRTFGEARKYYYDNYAIPNEQQHDKTYLDYFEEALGSKTPLIKIDEERCKQLFAEMAAKWQPATVVRRWTLLISVFRENKKWCPINPAKGIIPKLFRKKADRPKTVYFTNEEYAKLLEVADDPEDQDVLIVFRQTGFRKGEGERFCVEHCDFTMNTIFIPEQKNQEAGSIPMHPDVRQRVLEILQRRNITSGPILNMTDITRRFRRLVKKAGLYVPYPNNKTLHSLRHSFGTYTQKNYKDSNSTQKLMRQKTPRMTARYTHASNDTLRAALLAGGAPLVTGPNTARENSFSDQPLQNPSSSS